MIMSPTTKAGLGGGGGGGHIVFGTDPVGVGCRNVDQDEMTCRIQD